MHKRTIKTFSKKKARKVNIPILKEEYKTKSATEHILEKLKKTGRGERCINAVVKYISINLKLIISIYSFIL